MDYRERDYYLFDLFDNYDYKKSILQNIPTAKIRPNMFNTNHQEMISVRKEWTMTLLNEIRKFGVYESYRIVQITKDFCGQ